jgi:DNA-binding beta-propeller fold protein YncE
MAAPGYGTAATRDGRWLLVCVPAASQVTVIDIRTMHLARAILLPKAPHEIVVSPDNKAAYVSSSRSKLWRRWTCRLVGEEFD